MRTTKLKSGVFIFLTVLILISSIFFGPELAATEKDAQQTALEGDQKRSVEKETKKEKTIKSSITFVPTEKVSADQAVAFPTDI